MRPVLSRQFDCQFDLKIVAACGAERMLQSGVRSRNDGHVLKSIHQEHCRIRESSAREVLTRL